MHRVDVDGFACCRVGGIDAVIAAFHSVVPVQVFIRLSPVDRVAAVVDAHKGSVTGKGVQLFIALAVFELAIDQESVVHGKILYGNLARGKAVEQFGFLADPEAICRGTCIYALVCEFEYAGSPFAVTLIVQIEAAIMNQDCSVTVDVDAELGGIISVVNQPGFPSPLVVIIVSFVKSLQILAVDAEIVLSVSGALELPLRRTAADVRDAPVLIGVHRLHLKPVNSVLSIQKMLI